ncbi:hypothetical protein OHB54_12385 [Streptomyces sp. NBC_01007]|nr:hypothetical protein OHB54_12385 [Streptomyces sp. NBC_01007]
MTTPQELKDLFTYSLGLLSDARIEEWIDLFTEEGILEFPYPAWGLPTRMQGREALLAQMTMFREELKVEFSEPEFYAGGEAGLVVAGYTGECTLLATGASTTRPTCRWCASSGAGSPSTVTSGIRGW